ncbi:MAG: hypothetical protein ACREEB_11390 [Caulobacteraceae bacterium]
MTKPVQLVINVPFQGFYDSDYSQAIDSEESQWIEYHAEVNGYNGDSGEHYEESFPPELRLSESELAELLFAHTQYSIAYDAVARVYVDAFSYAFNEYTGIDLQLKFESMTSPREYNFGTDRLFAYIPLRAVRELFAISKAEGHKTLAKTIEDRFTSYDGFLSHYDNDLESWLAKPFRDWDHNELATLLGAVMVIRDVEDGGAGRRGSFAFALYDAISEDNGFGQAWESAVDWPAFEASRDEAREDKAADFADANPELAAELAALPVRCPDTLDLFGA